jgi:hypothetical protein
LPCIFGGSRDGLKVTKTEIMGCTEIIQREVLIKEELFEYDLE